MVRSRADVISEDGTLILAFHPFFQIQLYTQDYNYFDMVSFMKAALVLSLAVICSASAANCADDTDLKSWDKQTRYSSHCEGSSKFCNPFLDDLKACQKWLDYCATSISTSEGPFENIQNCSCTFKVLHKGIIEAIKIEKSSGSSETDTRLINALKQASPIKLGPPNLTPLMVNLRAKIVDGKLIVEAAL